MILTAKGVISSKNYDEWAEGYIKELEEDLDDYFKCGFRDLGPEALRFLRGEVGSSPSPGSPPSSPTQNSLRHRGR